mgnify:CR=1 FL=1
MKFKICGMKYHDNIKSVAELQPDYLGFIFYEKSKRNFDGIIPELNNEIIKTGVFVDESINFILKKIKEYQLKAVQLHGIESPEFCKELLKTQIEVIKVFSVDENFDFEILNNYKEVCDYFLFDTKGKERGGNGIAFDWNLLENNKSKKPYFLSGGLGLNEVEDLSNFFKTEVSKYCYALDVNSKFEDKPGLKNIQKLKLFIQDLKLRV